ncbi:MAG: glycine/sarcosine/betaine reductase complex component C subunit beta [Planctomycetota bacterium]
MRAVVSHACNLLVHVPDLVAHGSKPRREIALDPDHAGRLRAALRPFDAVTAYGPTQAFIGNRTPESLRSLPTPWHTHHLEHAAAEGPFGGIVDQESFYAALRAADILDPPLFETAQGWDERLTARLRERWPALAAGARDRAALGRTGTGASALELRLGEAVVGRFHRDERAEGRDDENLAAHHLLENCCAKASGALALHRLLTTAGIAPGAIDCIITCGEEAVGDRYQRGGGGMAKAIGEMCGCGNASGMDIKNFCAAPSNALITAAALVAAGVHARVAVVGGGALGKIGMKSSAFLQAGIPVLDDCLGAVAFLVEPDDGASPVLRLSPPAATGHAPISASSSDNAVYRKLVVDPLQACGLGFADVDHFAPELHNPEIMEFAGSGDVVRKNYRALAALAVLEGAITKAEMEGFIERVGMPGFAPTQGHIPSAVPFLGHALQRIRAGTARRVMFVARASLFLGRCTTLLDGVSFLLERNPAQGGE